MFAWPVLRPWILWISAALFLMGLFTLFAVVLGWPPVPEDCVDTYCYCEYFDVRDVTAGARGIRQPVNTWSNLYVFVTVPIIAFTLSRDRHRGDAANSMQSNGFWADLYVLVALFLGLGSMWLHASAAKHVAWMDGMSMYAFAGFLLFYTLDRIFVAHGASRGVRGTILLLGYPLVVMFFTQIGARGVNSEILVGLLVGLYGLLELLPRNLYFWQSNWRYWPMNFLGFRDGWAMTFWGIAGGSFLFAMTARALSAKPGDIWCSPHSAFQPHGLLWHSFSGVMALMLFFYWRRENRGRPPAPAPAAPAAERWT